MFALVDCAEETGRSFGYIISRHRTRDAAERARSRWVKRVRAKNRGAILATVVLDVDSYVRTADGRAMRY